MGSAVPQGDGVPVPEGGGIVQELGKLGQPLSLEGRSSAPAAFGLGWGKQIGVEAQAGKDACVLADGGKEFERGKGLSATMMMRRSGSQRWICRTAWRAQSSSVLGARGASA
jgi:hypothetical protein